MESAELILKDPKYHNEIKNIASFLTQIVSLLENLDNTTARLIIVKILKILSQDFKAKNEFGNLQVIKKLIPKISISNENIFKQSLEIFKSLLDIDYKLLDNIEEFKEELNDQINQEELQTLSQHKNLIPNPPPQIQEEEIKERITCASFLTNLGKEQTNGQNLMAREMVVQGFFQFIFETLYNSSSENQLDLTILLAELLIKNDKNKEEFQYK